MAAVGATAGRGGAAEVLAAGEADVLAAAGETAGIGSAGGVGGMAAGGVTADGIAAAGGVTVSPLRPVRLAGPGRLFLGGEGPSGSE